MKKTWVALKKDHTLTKKEIISSEAAAETHQRKEIHSKR